MKSRRLFTFLTMIAVLAGLFATSAQAHNIPGGANPKAQATAQATAAATAYTGDNAYLKSYFRRLNETYDTSKFKKNGPYKIALAAQGPTNSWATLFDAHARYRFDQ